MSLIIIGLCAVTVSALVLAGLGAKTTKHERANLNRAKTHDHVTGLLNRDGLRPALESALRTGSTHSERCAVLAIEIDKLNSVNTTYGHEVGDALLVAITRQLTRALRQGEQAIRYGGPQFIVLSPGINGADAALGRARELNRALRVPYQIGIDLLRITPSIGVAVSNSTGNDPDGLVADALLASASTDNLDSGGVTLFELSMRSRPSLILTEQRLHAALDNEEFWLLYLPVVELDTNKIVGVEALLRWADPTRGMLPPSEFLEILEHTGLMVPVGSWVINEACQQNARWSERFPDKDLVTTLNIAKSQLIHPDFFDTVVTAVESAGITPDRLCLEISEESLTHDVETTWSVLRRAKEAGFKLAIDDFGIGFSSLSNLRYLQLDILKVGRSFIEGLGTNREDEAIVQQLVALSHALGVVPVAEGVETAVQAQALKGVGCDFAQGYWFSKPEPAATIDKLLEQGKIRAGSDNPSIDWTGGPALTP